MSSHREAPEISKDPVADNTDVYAFVSPDKPGTVTIITNFVPLAGPARRPELLRVRRRRPVLDLHRQRRRRRSPTSSTSFRFNTKLRNPNTFLYNTGPIASLDDPNWNKRQFYSVTRVAPAGGSASGKVLGQNLRLPAVQHRAALDAGLRRPSPSAAVHTLPTGEKVFAGQRNDGFFVDLGAIFDLGRPAAVPEPAPDPDCGRGGCGHAGRR